MTTEQQPELKDVTTSPQVNEIAAALAKAQLAIKGAVKDSTNPHFKSSYADLASVWDACHEALNANGIAVVQMPNVSGGENVLITMLVHSSGQWFRSFYRIRPVKDDPQGMGSAVTYARRYSLAAMAGVAPKDDDDGEAASGRGGGGGKWDQLRGDEPKQEARPERATLEFKQVADSCDSLPDDIADARREFAPFKGKKFSEISEADVAAIGRMIEEMAQKTKSQSNRVALTVLAAILRNETNKRKVAS